MRRGGKPTKPKVAAKPPGVRKSLENADSRVRDLEKRLAVALEQQAATSEILRVISRSPTDVQPVFEAIARSATELCHGLFGGVFLREGDAVDLVAHHNFTPEGLAAFRQLYPLPVDADSNTTRALRERRPIHVTDVQTDPAVPPPVRSIAHALGFRSLIMVPMLRESLALGVIGVSRSAVKPFSEREIVLLQTFADQAVIAIENVRLFTELQTSNRELTTALDTQTATSDILRVISRSPTDVQPVFDAIVHSAVLLLHGYSGTLTRLSGDRIELAALTSTDPTSDAAVRAFFPQMLDFAGGHSQAIRDRAPVNVGDAHTDPRLSDSPHAPARTRGYRSVGVVPLLRYDEALGAIAVTRREPGGFTDDEMVLLQTFADQAVIAIENVRLFKELEARNADLSEALERQTATAEILRVISSAPTDIQTVFDTIIRSAVTLCGALFGVVFRFDGQLLHFVAHHNLTEVGLEAFRRGYPRPPARDSINGPAVVQRTVVSIPDVLAEVRSPIAQEALGYRSVLVVPMIREGVAIGAIGVARTRIGRFPDKQIDLLTTFADQAVIAIENVRLFKELEQKTRDLQAASQHKSEFLASMSHELRTPLNAIIGFSEVLTDRMFGELTEKQEEYLRDIMESGRHLLSLINDILDLSKIEAGRMELEVTEFDLPQAIDNALTLVRERVGHRGIALQQSVDERLGEIRGDERKVKQVLLNLLSNALKFTPEGGRIDVRAKLADGVAEISVTDTGIGIAPEDQEKVFEEFQQVGSAAKKTEGTGLGLALSRKFVELHGGRIWVKSQVAAGSTFTFTIPVRREPSDRGDAQTLIS